MGRKKKYSNIFGSFTEPFNYLPVHFLDDAASVYVLSVRVDSKVQSLLVKSSLTH